MIDAYVDKPMPRKTTATKRERALDHRGAHLSGADATSTTAAASIDPAPAKTSAAPTGGAAGDHERDTDTVTIAKKRL